MSDYDEIRNLIASYSHSADDGAFQAYAANFTEDGVLVDGEREIPASTLVELQAAHSQARAGKPQPNGSKHLQVNTVIKLDGDKASAVTDLVIIRLAPETGWTIGGAGRYDDEIVKINGRWLFRRREISWYKSPTPNRSDREFSARADQALP
jgi:3-phenylpropionate/cinnamic acid dioxygenase small subunit